MNNLDSRCPNIVNVEVNFNNFMTDIFDGWKNRQENADVIEDYEFVGEWVWGKTAKDFHKLINEEYSNYLNKLMNNPSAFEDLTTEFWEIMDGEFHWWLDEEWIKLIYDE